MFPFRQRESEGRGGPLIEMCEHFDAGHSRPTIEMQLPDFDAIRHTGSELIST